MDTSDTRCVGLIWSSNANSSCRGSTPLGSARLETPSVKDGFPTCSPITPTVCRRMSLRNILNPLSVSAPFAATASLSSTNYNDNMSSAACESRNLPTDTSSVESPAAEIAAMSEKDIEVAIKAQISQHPPQHPFRARELQKRVSQLILDPWIERGSILTNRVTCYGCGKYYVLDNRRDYYPNLWAKHRDACIGCKDLGPKYESGLPVRWCKPKKRASRANLASKKLEKATQDVIQRRAFSRKFPKDEGTVGQDVSQRKATITLPEQTIATDHMDVDGDATDRGDWEDNAPSINRPLRLRRKDTVESSVATKWLRKLDLKNSAPRTE